MDAQVPLVMALDDPGAVPGVAGGKGASLARLARAGFRVPPGFHVTTSAYLDFIGRGGLREPVLAAMSAVDVSDAATFDAAAARIGELFAGQPMPAPTAAAIAGAYACLGDDVPVAVRSSATVEDLPGMSAAGQHDTYLNVRGEAAVLDAVRRCWASLWSARAIGYRARHGVEPGEVSIAVVVQQLVPAEAAGVMFTIDPVDGGRDKVVVSANWGLGESVVAGEVTPDVAVIDRASGTLVSYQVGSKEMMTVADGTATRAAGTPAGLRSAAVLSPAQAGELARVGLAIEKLYDEPVDIEWALAAGELSVVQARPITTPASRPAAGPGEQWNDSLAGDYLWSNGNLGEALPDVMTPATWSFVELLMSRMTFPPSLPGYLGYGRIGGRFYANVSMSISLEALIGISPRRFAALFSPVLGKLPPVEEIPRPRLPRWKATRLMVPAAIAMLRRVRASQKRMPQFLADAPSRCERLRAEIEQTTDPTVLASTVAREGPAAARGGLRHARRRGVRTAPRCCPLPESWRSWSARPTRPCCSPASRPKAPPWPVSARLWASPGSPEARSTGIPSPASTGTAAPTRWSCRSRDLPRIPPGSTTSSPPSTTPPTTLMRCWQTSKRPAPRPGSGWHSQDPKKAAAARKLIARWAPVARDREAARTEVARSAWVARTWVRRAGQLTGHGEDLFFLELPETVGLLRGDPAPLAQVPARRAAYETYQALPPYPALIRGRFDPIRWAADPNRRSDYYDERARPAKPADTITGFPGAAGVVEGIARVLRTPEDAAQLGDGEILVTTVTNIGWTPIFPRAAAVVTDVGAPLSHAAIVARELGIPAVVGCGNATMLLHSGDRVRVDGSHGTVEVLHQA